MCEIDEDPEAVACGDEPPSRPPEPLAGIRRGWETESYALRERVRPAPNETERAQSSGVELVEVTEVRLDRLGTLEMEDRRDGAAFQGGLDIVRRARHAHLFAGRELVQQVDDHPGLMPRVLRRKRPGKR